MSTFIVSSHEIPPAGPAGLNRTLQPGGLYFIIFLKWLSVYFVCFCFFLRVENHKKPSASSGRVGEEDTREKDGNPRRRRHRRNPEPQLHQRMTD